MTEPVAADTVTGGCLCDAVRFRITLPTLFCAHCHCSMCRRPHGAAFVTWTAVPPELARKQGRNAQREEQDHAPCQHRGPVPPVVVARLTVVGPHVERAGPVERRVVCAPLLLDLQLKKRNVYPLRVG